MNGKLRQATAISLVLLALLVLLASNAGFVNATYTIHQNHTIISIQSPAPNASYVESSLPLVVNLSVIYGTTTTIDEFAFQNLTCSYNLDNSEWKNITSMNITSNKSQPDINYYYGLLHRLEVTFNTTIQNLSTGLHSINIILKSTDSWDNYQNTSQVYFTINTKSSPTPTITPNTTPNQTPTQSATPTLALSPSIPEFPTWIILPLALIILMLTTVVAKRKRNN
jgi:hypothetical protein